MTDTKWGSIPWAEGYQVSDVGEVRSFRRHGKPRTLTPRPEKRGGYLKVGISGATGRTRNQYVHSLVAETFLGQRPKGSEIRHGDGDVLNNRVDNLSYGTAKENAEDRATHGTQHRGESTGNSVLKEQQVREIKLALTQGGRTGELAARYGVGLATITDIKKGRSWKWLT